MYKNESIYPFPLTFSSYWPAVGLPRNRHQKWHTYEASRNTRVQAVMDYLDSVPSWTWAYCKQCKFVYVNLPVVPCQMNSALSCLWNKVEHLSEVVVVELIHPLRIWLLMCLYWTCRLPCTVYVLGWQCPDGSWLHWLSVMYVYRYVFVIPRSHVKSDKANS